MSSLAVADCGVFGYAQGCFGVGDYKNMAFTPFKAALATPDALVFEGEVTMVILPAHDGGLGVLNRHASFVTRLGAGILKLEMDQENTRFVVNGGYAQMRDNVLNIVAEEALPEKQITAEFVGRERDKAEGLSADSPDMAARRRLALDRVAAMELLLEI